MQPLRIVIDVRHIKDFGIGTYIRNLVEALGELDPENRYLLSAKYARYSRSAGLPGNFETVVYHESQRSQWDNVAYPWFLKSLAPDLVHLPLNNGRCSCGIRTW